MQKEVKYGGLVTTPSDYDSADGEMSMLMNLVPEDGALKPQYAPFSSYSIDHGGKVLGLHKSEGKTRLIFQLTEGEGAGRLQWKVLA